MAVFAFRFWIVAILVLREPSATRRCWQDAVDSRAACAEAVTSRFRAIGSDSCGGVCGRCHFRAVGSDSCGGSAAAACVRSKAYAGWKALSAVRLEFAVESWTLERRAERVSSRY